MSELKTLKDMEYQGRPYLIPELVSMDLLRQEAIKWFKKSDRYAEADWRMMFYDFFNLTEEELK